MIWQNNENWETSYEIFDFFKIYISIFNPHAVGIGNLKYNELNNFQISIF